MKIAEEPATTSKRTISMTSSLVYFVISLVFNSFGNVLTLVTSSHIHPQFLGSAYWTAAEANLGHAILGNNSTALFWAFLVLGMMISFLNAILMHELDWHRIFGNFLFLLPFSIFIQWFSNIFNQIMPDATTTPMVVIYILINFIGVIFIGTAISIYQRVNLVLHPADDLTQILRFRYFHGNATIAMWVSYVPPTIMALIAVLMTGTITNFGLGTLFAFLFQGSVTGIADRIVFPKLKHEALDVGR
ncbi:fructose permease [Secundilactobacillus folii]|uniref:Fructose permease n=1 Tax=Secundilactobacillus folii TaxID=2678357 RepID=A0A7X2XVU1_9LACO|nr:fructose permease [Secundilactobacillus folii]MTV82569.1 fructose permease [Secundilactobacillus folii]